MRLTRKPRLFRACHQSPQDSRWFWMAAQWCCATQRRTRCTVKPRGAAWWPSGTTPEGPPPNAGRVAGASAMLLALASQLAGAQDVPVDAAQSYGIDLPLAPDTASPAQAAGPLGWTAAGALLAMALWPSRTVRPTEDV